MKNFDIAKDHELSIAVMNLVAIEEHLGFTISKTNKSNYIEIYNFVRSLRSKYLRKLVKNSDGECWCISKHLLATTMRLLETGVKYGAENKEKEAMELFNDAVDTYKLFWLIQNLNENETKSDTKKISKS